MRHQAAAKREPSEFRDISPTGSLSMFEVDSGGRLNASLAKSRMGMEFRWRDRPVLASLHASDTGATGIMVIRTQLGRTPSSALAAAARPDAFALMHLLPALLADRWSLAIDADHRLQLQAEMDVAMPALISDLLVPAVQFCLQVSPYLDLLEENSMGLRA